LLPHLTAIVQPDVVADALGKKQTQSQDSVLGKKKKLLAMNPQTEPIPKNCYVASFKYG
jgi:hypothetical protein